ncbi:HET-domain-containing protein [Daldinia decipiens]|uniref:HET-domain-containing protein n=1 Tax=Daldinia decipiens TaxID=326647 RepID=UPI0020C24164|nr:HET-domain-containing protein [Daldinia decipiens]KAI1661974.1 HET-domain-containing protein [Daldinia decipiens]
MKYEYIPLDPASQDIRLVTILPGKFDDPIQIKITHAPLIPPNEDDKPKRMSLASLRRTLPQSWNARETLEGRIIFRNYEGWCSSWDHPDPDFPRDRYELHGDGKPSVKFEALSYTWGSPKVKEKAVVRGEEEARGLKALRTQRLPIQANLQEAIRHLRYEDRGRVMWIDALCINQDDLDERSEQVKRMGLIYTLAHRVVAWLGPGSPNSDVAFSKLAYLGRQIEHNKDGTMVSAPGCTEDKWFSSKKALPWDAATWDAISETCSRDWFARLWIVQEIHLGNADSVLRCGRSEIPWAFFRRAVICIHAKDVGVPEALWYKTQQIKFLCEHLASMPFTDVLKNHHMRLCLNARDRIYGLLSLAPPEITRYITPDYKKSPLEVFRGVFLAFVKHEKRVSLLPYARRRDAATTAMATTTTTTPEWPTWLPDWSRYLHITTAHHVGFCASGISASRAKYVDPGRLEVSALYFASVSCVGAKISTENFADFRTTCRRIGLDRLKGAPYPSRGTYRDAWLETLALGRVEDRCYGIGYPSLAGLAAMVAAPEGSEADEEKALSDGWKIWTTGRINGCYLFSTQNGYVGMINGELQQGDEVFVVLGCNVPMLLRPTASGEYEVVGDCYVHGIMDGEALFGSIPPPWTAQIGPGEDNRVRVMYYNEKTGDIYRDHQRLQEVPVPTGWEEITEWEKSQADPLYCKRFYNKETGEVINSDPRLFPEAFRERGVPVETITLV